MAEDWLAEIERSLLRASPRRRPDEHPLSMEQCWRLVDEIKRLRGELEQQRYLSIPCPLCRRLRLQYTPATNALVCEKCGADAEVITFSITHRIMAR